MTKRIFGIASALFITHVSMLANADGQYAGKKVIYVDSYHAGYTWSDGVARGIEEVFQDTGIELKRIEMDTKRHTSESFKNTAALSAKAEIERFKPDVVIACDDNASKYLVMPYYKNADLPFVFCGLNWDTSEYGFPYDNTTGMVEISMMPQVIKQLGRYAKGNRIGYLGDNTLTSQKNLQNHTDRLNIKYDQIYLVDSFEQWKRMYLELQDNVDMAIILNNAGIPDWDNQKALEFVENNSRIPTGTNNEWMMQFSLLGIIKIPEEQGRWSAQAALKIMDGTPPTKIPITHNKQGKLYFNLKLGKKFGIDTAPAGSIVIEQE
ncbi:ABC transporter substrate-binding protein [Marinobacterium sp. D7]|uniref:ABC transporter substrate-binding protein n=1 Tax=Marinobacterium ramblicola TaxID=2849041 RepID=UPI001C2D89AF|nr:ABC transporter substrate-binding protein [Marinobacterium ramblicola]MBV1787361.1 ABC transporter substrate-binding protein [Marinobacterium ramblicola]